jgi:hypothetical protein
VHAFLDHLAEPAETARSVCSESRAFQALDACRAVGAWLRQSHDAQVGRARASRAARRGGRPPPRRHLQHSAASRRDVRVIDFDFASPGDPLEDRAYFLWSWTPLWHDSAAVRQKLGEVTVADRLHKFAAVVAG